MLLVSLILMKVTFDGLPSYDFLIHSLSKLLFIAFFISYVVTSHYFLAVLASVVLPKKPNDKSQALEQPCDPWGYLLCRHLLPATLKPAGWAGLGVGVGGPASWVPTVAPPLASCVILGTFTGFRASESSLQ